MKRAQADLDLDPDGDLRNRVAALQEVFPERGSRPRWTIGKKSRPLCSTSWRSNIRTTRRSWPRAEKVVTEATDFVRKKNLVTVPDKPLKVIVMPEFKRGQGIAYCDSPGPLEKNGKTFFACEPTPKDWSDERKESFFREYNNFMLRDLTVHEAMPGHYLQIAHANEFRAPTLVRADFPKRHFH